MKTSDLFKCPQCGGSRLEEVMENVTASTVVESIGEGGDVEYGKVSHEDGNVVRFQCVSCGWEVPGVIDALGLWDYLNSSDSECKPNVA